MNDFNYNKFHSQLALPYLETKHKCIEEIFQLLELEFGLKKKSTQKFIDLGSGDGRIVIYSAINYGIKSIGIEINNNLIREAKEHVKILKKNKSFKRRFLNKIKFIEADFFIFDLKEYDYIYIYSLPSMHSYLRHVFKTIKPKVIIISHKYELAQLKSLIKFESKLIHKRGNEELSTYFYSRNDSESM
ncbi:MAG: methyltransferase domain-containing protein [Promethearchaeota archaeon]